MAKPMRRTPAEWHHALIAGLGLAQQRSPRTHVHVAKVQADQLAHAHATAVGQFQPGAIAQAYGRLYVGRDQQAQHLGLARDRAWQGLPRLGWGNHGLTGRQTASVAMANQNALRCAPAAGMPSAAVMGERGGGQGMAEE